MPDKQLARAPVAKTWWASGEHPEGEPAGGSAAEGLTAAAGDEKAGPLGGEVDEKDDV